MSWEAASSISQPWQTTAMPRIKLRQDATTSFSARRTHMHTTSGVWGCCCAGVGGEAQISGKEEMTKAADVVLVGVAGLELQSQQQQGSFGDDEQRCIKMPVWLWVWGMKGVALKKPSPSPLSLLPL